MSSRIHRKNIIYHDDGCWEYSSKMYNTKKYDKTAKLKHERKQIASSSKDPPPSNFDIYSYKTYTSPQTKIKFIKLDNPMNAIYN